MEQFTIGKLARRAGVGVETIRFYERRGLIKKPSVKEGFRKYSEEAVRRICFIKRAQDLGFTLKEINGLMALNANPRSTCSDVRSQTEAKMKEVEEKIRDLKRIKKSLKHLFIACEESKEAMAHCELLNCFEPDGKCK